MSNYLETLEKRRSIYALGKNVNVEASQIEGTIKEAVRLSPSAFNSQTSRVVILTGESQTQLWDLVAEDLKIEMKRQGVPDEAFEGTKQKLEGFKAAFGTALFFEDTAIVKNLQEQFALYADKFPDWSEQSTGIAAINAWTALAELEIGANLQHYNPVINDSVAKVWAIPENWELKSQLVFGSIEAPASEKEFTSDDERFKVFH
ncbi:MULTISPECIES: nitroreductase family protein [unclassified Enterococcus]|uniref:nitroreductase family protein n=1 Tax=unclassified Enterococcus TaxID=2608891 RepID=UPI00155776B9|nr:MULTISPECIES: nitroreductase family protein [unclassified Enterococcus]MBS7577214.1 nitroreductase family protein [Enterococcus sp. MMGLQ5-2]MBS7584693.1 nitroreductase family protein [Enterococcus sp. MMGLQ5-1]NPD12548.1 nitroreductase family protein [Enterococcus sp. MMGLQ5-1]NPD37048.1 nitroreductase family protein [Enterococcus sp. MMGLQ5-2]